MARTANVFVRIEPEVKEQAELILEKLGIPMSNAVGMFLRQIVMNKGLPFEVKLPESEMLVLEKMTKEQLNDELKKAEDSIKAGKVYTIEDVETEMKKEFGV